ncbi:hypothetical protein PIB30_002448 [Stylosanthes scabra]|uniref:Uncharacterized protein n=1 Tax=Stylosanthes scabra TaxID=79078 RepID=A0ABU6W3T4_9FABA|nr:hypothetical protein [Stylosanthes scabra]
MPWGECTATLEDVAYQLGLHIDREPISGCLWDFEAHMAEGTGRPRWEWFQEMFGELSEIGVRDACTVTFSWLKSRFGELLDDASDDSRSRSLAPFSRAHRRARSMQLGVRSPCLDVQEPVPSSQQECCSGGRAVGSAAELDFLAISDP